MCGRNISRENPIDDYEGDDMAECRTLWDGIGIRTGSLERELLILH